MRSLVMRKRCAALALLAITLSGCAFHVNDKVFLRATQGGTISESSIQKALPGYSFSDEMVPTIDGFRIYRVRFTRPDTTHIVLFFGGNLSTVEKHAVSTAMTLANSVRADFVFADYRGYGQSSGTPSLDALRTDSRLLFDQESLRASAEKKKLIVAGYSLGSVVAGALLEEKRAAAAILFTTITTPMDAVNAKLPWYLNRLGSVTFDENLKQIDNARSLAKFGGPTLLVGAEHDDQTPAALTRKLYEAIKRDRRDVSMVIVDSGHNDVLEQPATKAAVKSFVDKLAP
jgi:uncharacterized protein